MGLYGALVVHPSAPAAGCAASAYNHAATCFDREYLFLLSEVDIDIHRRRSMQASGPGPDRRSAPSRTIPSTGCINGRAAPDTMAAAGDSAAADAALQRHAAHASRRAAAAAGGGRGARHASLPHPRQPRARPRPRRPAAAERHRRDQARRAAAVHHPIGAGRNGRRDLRVDRQGPGLGHLRSRRGRRQRLHGYSDNTTGASARTATTMSTPASTTASGAPTIPGRSP